jgi:GMP synthase-like glutamine amidotransferase
MVTAMKPVLVFRHISFEGPGYLQSFLEARDIPIRVLRIDEGETVPAGFDHVSGLVFMGGPMSVNDDLDWLRAEINLIRAAMGEGLAVLGHCLGGQLIARALGAQVRPNPVREIGWHPVQRLDNDAAREWLGGDDALPDCFHWHGETFEIPEDATPVLGSRFCANQAFVSGRVMAMQCHIEMTAPMVREWSRRYADQLNEPSASVQTAAAMVENLDARIAGLNTLAERVYSRWIEGLEQ